MIDVERLRGLTLAMWNDGDTSAIDELYSENFVGHDPQNPMTGRQGVRDWYDATKATAPDIHLELHETVASGDMACTRWTVSGTDTGGFQGAPPTNESWVVTGMTMSKFDDGKIVESWANGDMLGLMQQLGFVPETTG